MFDTIVFRLHNLALNYGYLYNLIVENPDSYVKQDYVVYGNRSLLDRTITEMKNSGDVRDRFSKASYQSASSHYKINIYVDISQDFIKFDLSLPKYFFGHNLCQLVPHPHIDPRFLPIQGMNTTISYNAENLYSTLKNLLNQFFLMEFPQVKIDLMDVEILRFDLCFNQLFPDKKSALQYLEIQKKFQKKHLRLENSVARAYDSSIFYSNKDYSFKIYHKGTEFLKNDKLKLEKINSRQALLGKEKFDIASLSSFADRILRYEMTFRKSYVSKIYHSKLWRAKVSQWQRYKKLYNKLSYLDQKGLFSLQSEQMINIINSLLDGFDKPGSRLRNIMSVVLKKNDPYAMRKPSPTFVMSILVKYFNRYQQIATYSRDCYMGLQPDSLELFRNDRDTMDLFLKISIEIKMGKQLLIACCKKFWDLIKDFQPKQMDNYVNNMKLLKDYNELQEKKRAEFKKMGLKAEAKKCIKMDEPTMQMLLLGLQHYSFDDFAKKMKWDRTTKYRYNCKLKLLNIDNRQVSFLLPFKPTIDFVPYYQHFNFNLHEFSGSFKKSLFN